MDRIRGPVTASNALAFFSKTMDSVAAVRASARCSVFSTLPPPAWECSNNPAVNITESGVPLRPQLPGSIGPISRPPAPWARRWPRWFEHERPDKCPLLWEKDSVILARHSRFMYPPPTMEKPVILLADDEAPVRDFIREILETAGYVVLIAADGEQALQVSRT